MYARVTPNSELFLKDTDGGEHKHILLTQRLPARPVLR